MPAMPDEPISWSHAISGDGLVVSVSAEVTKVTYHGELMAEAGPGIWMDPQMADGTDAPREDR